MVYQGIDELNSSRRGRDGRIVILDDDIGLPCQKQQRLSVRACSWFVMTTTDGILSVIIQISPRHGQQLSPIPLSGKSCCEFSPISMRKTSS